MINSANASTAATLWATYELTLIGPADGNPFQDIKLGAIFSQGARKVQVSGFYDGDGNYKLRFLPDAMGVNRRPKFTPYRRPILTPHML
ncbi:DUF5060 domain-containing protein [Rhizobium leguminosarum]|uniref:DUF5060 domain-containing protein n=1 Tax=Rhizobium leguminosarum TaxID=384 RepID=UPI0024B35943|nr:DUF5060 domain-containing protein [Rhizobium leguminosarum]WHO84128.1 DUF5060 domain-containing protein [Rhizobium leguminosarum]